MLVVCVILTTALLISCNQSPSGYDRQEVADIIASHDTTILYFMTSWCQAGQHDFENNLKPRLGNASDSKAIVVVCIGELAEVMRLSGLNDNLFLFNKASQQGFFDKMFINNECKKLLNDYKRVDYVPLGMVCNREGEILNWNTNEELDRTYVSIYLFL